MEQTIYHAQQALISLSMVICLQVILVTLVQTRTRRTLFDRYGFGMFGIYHIAMYGERRNRTRG